MTQIKFAHLSDAHLGAWRKDSLKQLVYQAFEMAIDKIIEEKVDFVIISGDLYNVCDPVIDAVDLATRNLKRLADLGIPVYGIMGSHDFSVSDRTMIKPLISGGFYNNVSSAHMSDEDKIQLDFTEDPKTDVKITGLRARKRGLEVKDFEDLDRDYLEAEPGVKVFVFHTAMTELRSPDVHDDFTITKAVLPPGFAYYAGGHIHKTYPTELREGDHVVTPAKAAPIVYPGSLFPVDFLELEQNVHGGFCIVQGELGKANKVAGLTVTWYPLHLMDVVSLDIDCDGKSVAELEKIIDAIVKSTDVAGKIVTARAHGKLRSGNIADLDLEWMLATFLEKGAYEALVNRAALFSATYARPETVEGTSRKDIEADLTTAHLEHMEIEGMTKDQIREKIPELMRILGEEKKEEASVKDYTAAIQKDFKKLFDIDS